MKKEAREVLSVVGRKEREAFIDEAIVAHNQAQLPVSVRQDLLLKENKRLTRESAAREMYIAELEEQIEELKKRKTPAVITPTVPTEPLTKAERKEIATEERVVMLTKGMSKHQVENKRLRKANWELVSFLARNNLSIPANLTSEHIENAG